MTENKQQRLENVQNLSDQVLLSAYATLSQSELISLPKAKYEKWEAIHDEIMRRLPEADDNERILRMFARLNHSDVFSFSGEVAERWQEHHDEILSRIINK